MQRKMSKTKFKTPRHAVSGLLSLPTPGISNSSRLSKSFSNRGDLQPPGPLQSVKRRALRGRRSVGSNEFQKVEDLHVLELDEDTETPRGRIEAFLNNANTDSPAGKSTRQTPGRQNARSFTHTPTEHIKTRSQSRSSQAERRESFTVPSPGGLFTPRVNIERLLEGSGSEYSLLTRSSVEHGQQSESKLPSSRRSRNWGQRVSSSPMYNSTLRDEEDDKRMSHGGSFRSLRRRRAFQIPDTYSPDAGVKSLSQETPSTQRPMNSRLSKSDSKIPRTSRTWGQRVSISPMNHSDLREADAASPGQRFKPRGHRKSFHIPQPPAPHEPELGPDDKEGASKAKEFTDQKHKEPQWDDGGSPAGLSKRSAECMPRDSFVPASEKKLSMDEEMRDKMKIYDLSDGSSDSDFTSELFMNMKSQLASADKNKTWSAATTTPRSSQKLGSGKRPFFSSSQNRARQTQSEPKVGRFSSGSHDPSALAVKRRRLDFGGSRKTIGSPMVDGSGRELSGTMEAAPSPVPSAPPSSTPLKRVQRSSRVQEVSGEVNGDTPITTISRHGQKYGDAIVAILPNETLSGLSPIKPVEEGEMANDMAIATDVQPDVTEELSPLTRSLVAMATKSDSKTASSQSPTGLGLGASVSPSHESAMRDRENGNVEDWEGSFRSLRHRSSSQALELPGPDDVAKSRTLSDEAELRQTTIHEGSDFHESSVSEPNKEGLENPETPENDSLGETSGLATPYIDMSKKPASLSARRLNLITPFRQNKGTPTKGAKKAVTSKQSNKSKIGSRDCDFVTRKMIKFYAERFTAMKMDKEVIDELVIASNKFWLENLKAAEGFAIHAGRKSITEADVTLLMKVQRMCNSTAELHDLIREYLPMELRCDLIPTAQACVPSKSK